MLDLYDYMAEHGSFERAVAYIARIETLCREAGKDFRIDANIGGKADASFVPYVPPIDVQLTRTQVTQGPFKLETDEWGHNQGPIEDYAVPPIGRIIDPGTVNPKIEAWGGPLDGTSYAEITTKSTGKIGWKAFLRPLSAHHGGVLAFRVTYEVIAFEFTVRK